MLPQAAKVADFPENDPTRYYKPCKVCHGTYLFLGRGLDGSATPRRGIPFCLCRWHIALPVGQISVANRLWSYPIVLTSGSSFWSGCSSSSYWDYFRPKPFLAR